MNELFLHTVQEWEAAKPEHVVYDHFFYKEGTNRVRKVHGRVKLVKRVSLNGSIVKRNCCRKVHWDGYGHALIGTHNARHHKEDIIFGK